MYSKHNVMELDPEKVLPQKGRHELIELDPERILPEVDVTIVACRSSSPRGKGYVYDLIDFKRKVIDRWYLPFIFIDGAVESIEQDMYPNKSTPLKYDDYDRYYIDHYMTPHIAQLSPQGLLFISMGMAENGYASIILNTHNGDINLVQGKDALRLHVQGGDFDADYKKWYFTCWPPTNKARHERGKNPAHFELRSIDLETLEEELIMTIKDRVSEETGEVTDPIPKRHHHVTLSEDRRYAVATSFDFDPKIPYPNCTPEEDPEGYKRTHEGGLRLEKLLTMDLKKKTYWQTLIPVPSTGHAEFDLDDHHILYASAHNISPITQGTVMEGPATLFKLRIRDGKSEIIGSYTNDRLYRITQHSVFRYKDKILIGVTVTPNKMVLVDSSDMSLFRSVTLYECEELIIDKHGIIDPQYPKAAYSLNPSKDGRYIVLEDSKTFFVYDVEEDRFLDERLPRQIPQGYAGEGHTRIAGQ